jgi:hypothetical protein
MTKNTIIAFFAGFALLGSACGGGGGSAAGFCDEVEALDNFDPLANVDLTADDPGAAMTEAFASMDDALGNLADAAPSEIKADVETIQSGISTLVTALEDADGDFFTLASDPAFAEQMEALDSPDFNAAAQRIEEYTSTECGIELDEG